MGEQHDEAAGSGWWRGGGGGRVGREEGEMEWEPSHDALILSQGLPNLTGTICIWEEWITIPQHTSVGTVWCGEVCRSLSGQDSLCLEV